MTNHNNNYYFTIHLKMIKEFNAIFNSSYDLLLNYFSDSEIDELKKKCMLEYETLYPQLPYIGGKENRETIHLIMGAIILAIAGELEKKDLSTHQIGEIIFKSFERYFKMRPIALRCIIGKFVSSSFFRRWMKTQVQFNTVKKYRDSFKMELVDIVESDYDFGYNYTECALYKFFSKKNAEKYLPYICLGDYALFRSLGIGFKRTQTIANGGSLCDFRFKKGLKTQQGWPPEELEEWNHR